jgi:hypothetical protein
MKKGKQWHSSGLHLFSHFLCWLAREASETECSHWGWKCQTKVW